MQETQETWVLSLDQEDPLEKGMATHSILAWRIPMYRGAWWATIHRVTRRQTWLKWLSMHAQNGTKISSLHFIHWHIFFKYLVSARNSAAAAKSLQSCLTLCDPIDSSPPGSPVPGILQARTLDWVAISFSNAWKWKVKVKSLSRVRLSATPWTVAYQAPPSMGFSRQEY